MSNNNIVTRIAPSPTGQMHMGTVRSALYNYLFAKQHGGTYIVRIEDTDKERNKEAWVDAIWEDFSWCGIEPDKTFRQSEHLERHKEVLATLIEEGKAYVSEEEAKDGSGRTVHVVRLKNPGKTITFNDLVRGEIIFDTEELGDFVIARAIDDPLYHLAVVVDDFDEAVTHVIRGEDHISNTPRQILIQEAMGAPRPEYAHLPLMLAPDKSKLSKRKHSDIATLEIYRNQGFLPESVINYLALIGWNPGTEEEFFSLEELIDSFSLDHVQKGGAMFDITKMRWMNQHYIKNQTREKNLKHFESFLDKKYLEVFQESDAAYADITERIETYGDLEDLEQNGEFTYYVAQPEYDPEGLIWKKGTKEDTIRHLTKLQELLETLSDFTAESTKSVMWDYATEEGRGDVLWPLRYALSGKDKSPDPFTLCEILGKEETLARITKALQSL